ncbi:uncharacterized protein LOC142329098 [Lycorma delicatula]|uniref:uncharacterized protein LOC142329098 n=1 Tax=Lycorma delicatula TaxID=130591 RepID=UPI003F50D93B
MRHKIAVSELMFCIEIPDTKKALGESLIKQSWNVSDKNLVDIYEFLMHMKDRVFNAIRLQVKKYKGNNIKYYIVVGVELQRCVADKCDFCEVNLHSSTRFALNVLENPTDLNEQYLKAYEKINESFERFIQMGSGWVMNKILRLDLSVSEFDPLYGGNSTYFPIPKALFKKHAVINVQNDDQKCFLWSILAHLFPNSNRYYRVSFYKKFENHLNMKGIHYPVCVKDIDKFEAQNPDIAVNVLCYDIKHDDDDKESFNPNNVYVKRVNNNNRKIIVCEREAKKRLAIHIEDCKQGKVQRIRMPNEWIGVGEKRRRGNIVSFKDYSATLRVPFVIYADFESFIIPKNPEPGSSNTSKTHIHKPCGYCYVIIDENGCAVESKLYRATTDDDKVVEKFLNDLCGKYEYFQNELSTNKEYNMSEKDQERFEKDSICVICGDVLDVNRVRHHSHTNDELVHSLFACKQIKMFKTTYSQFRNDINTNCDESKTKARAIFNLLIQRKGVYPYTYMKSASVFDETQLPPVEAFYDDLRREHISESDYMHAQNVWNQFKIKSLGEYHDFYMKLDVMLLADVFESFRNKMIDKNNLDPCHYISAPHLSWFAALKETKVELELVTDPDMYLFFEKGIRGGVSMIPNRYAVANDPNQEDYYDDNKPKKFIKYYDVRSLYGRCMMEPLPVNGFRWCDENELEYLFNTEDVKDDSETGYILEVDLIYPKHLHETHRDYPLAPEKKSIPNSMISPFLSDVKRVACKKLLCTLEDKHKYVLHYRTLKLYRQQGMVLTKIHRAVSFNQSPWLKDYVEKNFNAWCDTKDLIEKKVYKLLINSVYGKTIENVRKRIDMQLINDESKFKKLNASPRVKHYYIYGNGVVGLSMLKKNVYLNKPIYVGLTVTDLAKLIMYDYHYNHFLPRYGHENIKLLMTDTDSLLYSIIPTKEEHFDHDWDDKRLNEQDENVYAVDKYDIGRLKDEMKGQPIYEFVGLRAKMYSLLWGTHNFQQKKTAKGIKKGSRIVDKDCNLIVLNHEIYKDCLFNRNISHSTSKSLRSFNHQIYSIDQSKKALSPYDDKRFVLENLIDTLPYGHKEIEQYDN